MPIKDILVACDGTDAALHALGHATGLAQATEAHLTGVVAHGLSDVIKNVGPWVTEQVSEVLRQQDDERRLKIRHDFDAQTAGMGERVHFLDIAGQPDAALAQIARCYDLIVMGQAANGQSTAPGHFTAHPDEMAYRSGRPLLVVPEGAKAPVLPQRAVLAWDGKQAAARAMAVSRHLMDEIQSLVVLSVGDPAALHDPGAVDATRHLERHGLPAEPAQITGRHGGIAETILENCEAREADLLIMGAYEHAKLAEDLFGGVTNRILDQARLPVLMVH